MKLKLSTLALIVAIIFVFYYYFTYSPFHAIIVPVPPQTEEETMFEGFEVTPIDNIDEQSVTYLEQYAEK
jgi:hypothetical protein